jgi:hypothetical protein
MKPTYFLIAFLLLSSVLRAQEKKTLYQLEANAQLHNSGSIYKTGAGVAAGAYFPVSPSFNLGPMLTADFLRIGSPSRGYNPVALRFATIWFPESLMSKIAPSPVWSAMSFKAGLGHSFNYDITTERVLFNTAYFDVAFLLPTATRQINVHVGFSSFGVKEFADGSRPDPTLYTIGLSYNFYKK